jgi:hypothetical protein
MSIRVRIVLTILAAFTMPEMIPATAAHWLDAHLFLHAVLVDVPFCPPAPRALRNVPRAVLIGLHA